MQANAHPNLCKFLTSCLTDRKPHDASVAIEAVFGRKLEVRIVEDYPDGIFYRWSRSHGLDLVEFPPPRTQGWRLAPRFVGSFDLIPRCDKFERAVLVNLNDASNGFGLGFCDSQKFDNLIPDSEYIVSRGHSEAREALFDCDWSSRKDVVFWRGSTTGHQIGPEILDLPRIKLCLLALELEPLCDCKISDIVQIETMEKYDRVKDAGVLGERVPWTHWPLYKYHIDIDGNSSSWTGLFYKMIAGSVVLKVESIFDFRQWYYPRLVPWENFVPIKSDMSDLPEAIKRLRADDALARRIGRNAHQLAASLAYDQEMARTAETFKRYAEANN